MVLPKVTWTRAINVLLTHLNTKTETRGKLFITGYHNLGHFHSCAKHKSYHLRSFESCHQVKTMISAEFGFRLVKFCSGKLFWLGFHFLLSNGWDETRVFTVFQCLPTAELASVKSTSSVPGLLTTCLFSTSTQCNSILDFCLACWTQFWTHCGMRNICSQVFWNINELTGLTVPVWSSLQITAYFI